MVSTTTLTVVMASRELTSMNKPTTICKTLAVRLNGEAGDGLAECWSALSEVHSCTKEIIVFFLDHGETNLGLECCRAVSTLCHDCWPSMLTSLGFTSGESGILRDHCDTPSVPPRSTPTYVVSPPRSHPRPPMQFHHLGLHPLMWLRHLRLHPPIWFHHLRPHPSMWFHLPRLDVLITQLLRILR
ncbi:hypothetical protein C5167_014119 [Papaver somniferum]|uniref:Prolamin-like domain-containing protein n=2 Tax=Papaver somniferum TaxID=3469 RepID=A0A4Y7J5P6_PAPSO|nr:hypothetical protein C5167_014119 [Papaver somniferum]